MSAYHQPPWGAGPAAPAGAADYSHLRVSDADRAEVSDRLSRHFSDGRLDQAEFDERLERAMKAKTWADFDGLFADLPGEGPGSYPGGPGAGQVPSAAGQAYGPGPAMTGLAGACQPAWHRRHRVLFLVLAVAAAIILGPVLAHLFIPWLIVAAIAFIVLRIVGHRHPHQRPR